MFYTKKEMVKKHFQKVVYCCLCLLFTAVIEAIFFGLFILCG